MTLAPGMTLFYVPSSRYGQPREVTVERIGRKWAYLAGRNGRVDMETLAVDGGQYSSPAQCYGSREEWEAETERGKTWTTLRRAMPYSPPPGVSVADIRAAAHLLSIDVREDLS